MTPPLYAPKRLSDLDPKGEIHIFTGAINAPDALKTCVEAEGNFSPGVGSFGVYFWLFDPAQGRLAAPTQAGIPTRRGLGPDGSLVPWIEWEALDAVIRSELFSVVLPAPGGHAHVTACRVRVTNRADRRRSLRLFAALRPLGPAGYDVLSLEVSADGSALIRDGHPAIVGLTPATAAGVSAQDQVGGLARAGSLPPLRAATSATGDCSGALAYDFELAPGAVSSFDLICPVYAGRRAPSHRWDGVTEWFQLDEARPDDPDGVLQPDPGLSYYRALSVDQLLADAYAYWERNSGTARLDLPDPRWNEFIHAATGHFGMMLNDDNPDLAVVNLNVFNRDLSYMTSLLEKIGQRALAETYLRWYLRYPFSGRVEPEADNPGQILWTFSDHWRFTRDTDFVREVYPFVRRLCDLIRYLRTTPEPHYVYDDTLDYGDALPADRRKLIRPGACDGYHPEYTEAFDISGLRSAAELARVLGEEADAEAWMALAETLFQEYDTKFGTDLGREYGSYAVLWPARLYAFDDPVVVRRFGGIGRMDSTTWRYFPLATAHQGLYAGSRKAGYETVESHLAEEQMQGWYTFDEGGSSGVGSWPAYRTTWSCAMPREGTYDVLSAIAMPDGWGIAELWCLMRDCLVHEDTDRLVLLAGISPDWFEGGRAWEAAGLPTWYGLFSIRWDYRGLVGGKKLAKLSLTGEANPPGGFRLVLPETIAATARVTTPAGNAPPLGRDAFHLPAGTPLAFVEWNA